MPAYMSLAGKVTFCQNLADYANLLPPKTAGNA